MDDTDNPPRNCTAWDAEEAGPAWLFIVWNFSPTYMARTPNTRRPASSVTRWSPNLEVSTMFVQSAMIFMCEFQLELLLAAADN
jgi:hypothetical protein